MNFSVGRALCLVTVLCAFCGTTFAQQAPSPPPAVSAPAASKVAADYQIGPGDTIQVFVWRSPELSVTVPVRPDGRITTPLVEDMVAGGKTPAQLARDMEQVLSQYVRSPQVNVIVTIPRSVMSEIKMVGQLRNPQAVPFHEGMTVLDVVLAAGGLTEFAAPNRAKIVRSTGGKTTEIKLKLKDLLDKGDLRRNVVLQSGDVLIVPESRF
jgi:polysaccharide biosynthesis/export protein